MLTKKTSKFCVFFILMILVNISRADKDMDPILASILFGNDDKNINTKPLSNVIQIQATVNFSNSNLVLSNASSTNLNEIIKTSSELNVSPNTTRIQSTAASVAPAPICHTPGVQAHESDCKKYYDCSLVEGSENKSFHLITKSCPEKQAFNIELKRCSRDISSCPLDIKCQYKATIADPIKNNSYYLCEPRLIGSGFRIFHVNCGLYEIFYWGMRKCDVDLEYLPYHRPDQPKDIDVVKAELKILRKQDKLKLKAEEKLQQKKFVKAEQAAKQEAANFICVNEGSFASKIGNKFYIRCAKKNDVLKATSMQCGVRGTFYPELRACVYTYPSDDHTFSDDEDED